jgi:hypothetical protein
MGSHKKGGNSLNQEQYWRNLLAEEISAEHDRVQAYYRKRGMNKGGMTDEELTRLNIFKLCESIVRSTKDSPDFISSPPRPVEPVELSPEKTAKEEIDEINSFIEEQIEEFKDKEVKEDVILNLVKDKPRQNQFGEFI